MSVFRVNTKTWTTSWFSWFWGGSWAKWMKEPFLEVIPGWLTGKRRFSDLTIIPLDREHLGHNEWVLKSAGAEVGWLPGHSPSFTAPWAQRELGLCRMLPCICSLPPGDVSAAECVGPDSPWILGHWPAVLFYLDWSSERTRRVHFASPLPNAAGTGAHLSPRGCWKNASFSRWWSRQQPLCASESPAVQLWELSRASWSGSKGMRIIRTLVNHSGSLPHPHPPVTRFTQINYCLL